MEQTFGAIVGGTIGMLIVAIIGLAVGVVARLLMPGKDPGGWLMTILLGIAGSWVGGFLAAALGVSSKVPVFIAAVLGAMLVLLIYRMAKKP
jgi:uncharacterized membrane protein YeaQ/YmgE (transglycosylase-associated protein family)